MVVVCTNTSYVPKVVTEFAGSNSGAWEGNCGPAAYLTFAGMVSCGAFWTAYLSTPTNRHAMIVDQRFYSGSATLDPTRPNDDYSTTVTENNKGWRSQWMTDLFAAINLTKPNGTIYNEGSAADFDAIFLPALQNGKVAAVAVKYGPIDWYPAIVHGDGNYPNRHYVSGQWCFYNGHMIAVRNYRLASGISGITDGTPIITIFDPLSDGRSSASVGKKCNTDDDGSDDQSGFYASPTGTLVANGPQIIPVSVLRAACELYAGTGKFCGILSQAAVSSINPPVAGFTYSQNSGTLNVQFTDTTINSPATWAWNFGDSQTGTTQSPTHAFPSPSTYTVVLTVTNSAGSSTVSHSVIVNAIPPPGSAPVAAFTQSQVSGTLTEQFTDTSTNGPTSWLWNFGDSTTSTLRNPSHTYGSSGSKTVSLQGSNTSGTDTTSHSVSVAGLKPAGSFSFAQTNGTLTVVFSDLSTHTPTSWAWNFGDAGTATTQNPSHTYTIYGDYTVSLTATNASGSDAISQAVTVDPIPAPPPADTGNDPAPYDPCLNILPGS